MASLRLLLVACLVCVFPTAARAQLEPTTEFGYTVNSDDLINAMLESQRLWPAIRKHLVSEKFHFEKIETRQQASEFLQKVDDTITRRLIGAADPEVQDAIVFLSMRLRKFSLLRDMRDTIQDDAVFFRLKEQFEDGRYRANMLAATERGPILDETVAQLDATMIAAKLSDAKRTQALDGWKRLVRITERMNTTRIGELIIGFEREAKDSDPTLKHFMRCVVRAADWAIITKPAAQEQTRSSDFLKAWEACSRHEASQTAARK